MKIVLIILIAVIISGCNSHIKQNNSFPEFEISIKDNFHLSEWDDQIEDIHFIPLETKNKIIMGEIQKIIFKNNRIFIKCWKSGIFIFDEEGRFINLIGQKGKAPFQVYHLFDFSISSEGRLYLLDNGKLLIFNQDGHPISESFFDIKNKKLGHTINLYAFNTDTLYFWHKSDEVEYKYHLTLSDSTGDIKKMMMPYTHFSFAAARFIQCGEEEWGITPPSLQDTVFSIIKGKVVPKFTLKITDNSENIPDLIAYSRLDYIKSDQFIQYELKYDISDIRGDIVYNSNHLLVTARNINRGLLKRVLINISTNDVKYFKIPAEPENIFHPRKFYLSYNDYFVSSLDAWQVCKLVDEGKTSSQFLSGIRRDELLKSLKNVKETDNPVIMMIKFKEQ
ncbi:MAG: 6-bladed beta-propeller [Bacteroidales bacterium]